MIYNDYQDIKLSSLGMGCMRLPVIDGDDSKPDQNAVNEMVDYAIEHGINYFDTAWGYHSGMSEPTIGNALKRHPRKSFYITSKFPGYDVSNMPKVKEIFPKQLERCQVEYFDFYLFHNVCEVNIDGYLNPEFGIYDYLIEQKKNGRIKHLGFSAHGSCETIQRFLDAYGKDMEFCQLQINWLDWDFQGAKKKAELVSKYNIPLWVMEPLRGGKLCKLDDEDMDTLKKFRPDATATEWAFRFLQSLPEVKVTLSGMSNFEQLKENIATYDTYEPLNEEELETIFKIAEKMVSRTALPCTACRYCTTHCPMELDIPYLIELYNEHKFTGGGFLAPFALSTLDDDKKPSACLGCRSCEAVCPQQIKISEAMSDFVEILK